MSNCEICGEPMPAGEEMFKFHGYSCDCPKPPLQKTEVVAEFIFRDTCDGEFWMDVKINGRVEHQIQFDTSTERQRAHDDLMTMTRAHGAVDLPVHPQ